MTAVPAAGNETRADWLCGEALQPAFSPRSAAIPGQLLGADERTQVTLGWLHRYPARFAVEVLTEMIATAVSRCDRRIGLLVDPFAGTAATVAACRQLGIPSAGVEFTHLGALIGTLRTVAPRDPWAAAHQCEAITRSHATSTRTIDDELAGWLGPANANLLARYLDAVDNLEGVRERRFATVALSQALRSASRWLRGSIKPQIDPDRAPVPLNLAFARWARQLARDLNAEQAASATVSDLLGVGLPRGTVIHGDARRLPFADASTDAIVTSPPYFTTYDYFDVQRLSYLAFGWPMPRGDQIGAKYGQARAATYPDLPQPFDVWFEHFGGEATTDGRALRAYVEALRDHLREARRVSASGGVVCYSLANSVRSGRAFNLVAGFEAMLDEVGFVDISVEARTQEGRRILPAGRNSSTGRFSSSAAHAGVREYVVFGRRP